MPTNEDFREALKYFGLGWYGERQIGVAMAKFLAKKWNIVLVEPSQKSLENDNG